MLLVNWFSSLMRSVRCNTELFDVQDPKGNSGEPRKPCLLKSGCSKSLSNLREVVHGSRRHKYKAAKDSPGSIGINNILNPITHHVILTDSKYEVKIKTKCCDIGNDKGGSNFMCTLRPETSSTGHCSVKPVYSGRRSVNISSRIPNDPCFVGSGNGISSRRRTSLDAESRGYVCQKCGEYFTKVEAIEEHHLSRHAVTALSEGEDSWKMVELICQKSFSESESKFNQIERILKVQNTQSKLADFEDFREMVKIKASKLQKVHPRCLADGNELLRFYGTTVACPLSSTNTSSLCTMGRCGVCQILRHGFLSKKAFNGFRGVFTSSTSKRAFEYVDENRTLRKALVVCRVIAGTVHKSSENIREISTFDSLAGKVGCHSNTDELYSLNPRALLPCFVVICKPSKQSA